MRHRLAHLPLPCRAGALMALSPRIELRQSQQLVMTPQLQQAIKLLQMSNLQLAEYLAGEVEKNPLLEMAPPAPGAGPAPGGARRGDGSEGNWIEGIAAEPTLYDHLRSQIGAMRAPGGDVEAALIVADELEEDGYLRVPLAEVAGRHRLSAREAAAGLALVQACDPAGVGARDLKECLALQLEERDRLDPAMAALLDNLALAARGRTAELEARCGVDAEDIADMLAEIRALDPKPGLRFARERVEVAVPDVHVRRREGGGWAVELNAETLPRVLMNNVYAARLGGRDPEARAFVSECRASAGWLVRSLEQRARTILKVATALVERQERLLRARGWRPKAADPARGRRPGRPARVDGEPGRLRQVPRLRPGLLRVPLLLQLGDPGRRRRRGVLGGRGAGADPRADRGRAGRAPAVGRQNRREASRAEGIDIARRTVAKYREGMGIPSSVERRRLKNPLPGP